MPQKLPDPQTACLSCVHAIVDARRRDLRVVCTRGEKRATGCTQAVERGLAPLLAIVSARLVAWQRAYRTGFEAFAPPCARCRVNCCATPYLPLTPHYPEDAIHRILRGLPKLAIDRAEKRCVFLAASGCTLERDARPHACIAHGCHFPAPDAADRLAEPAALQAIAARIEMGTRDLLAVATLDLEAWLGPFDAGEAGRVRDRFGRSLRIGAALDDIANYYRDHCAG